MNEELFMRRCFQLALAGAGSVSPNPMVGAVLVHEGKVIGEGWHQYWGGPHAEVNCIRSVSPENQVFIPHATLYCNLEPCSHFGKTPPCTDLILQYKIPRVVVANTDPNPLVAGKGLTKLREAGVQITEGILAEEGRRLNRFFFTWISEQRPYIVLKWAQSADGFLGKPDERIAISGPESKRLVHRWRAECDAILVGLNTALTDNPRLDTRHYFGKNPLRVVLDCQGKIPPGHALLDDTIDTLVFGPHPGNGSYARTRFTGHTGSVAIPDLLDFLHKDNRAILLVEGGANVLNQFLSSGLWDEIRVLKSPRSLEAGLPAPGIPVDAVLQSEFLLGADRICIFAR